MTKTDTRTHAHQHAPARMRRHTPVALLSISSTRFRARERANPAAAVSGGGVPWRPPNIRHRKNEMFLDVVERVNMLINASGETLHSEIHGTLEMTAHLSGMQHKPRGSNVSVCS